MTRARQTSRGSHGRQPKVRERLQMVRDGLVLARRVLPGDETTARREILRARGELRRALRTLASRREMAPLLAPLMSLILELSGLLSSRD
jgi:hypothetical protein